MATATSPPSKPTGFRGHSSSLTVRLLLAPTLFPPFPPPLFPAHHLWCRAAQPGSTTLYWTVLDCTVLTASCHLPHPGSRRRPHHLQDPLHCRYRLQDLFGGHCDPSHLFCIIHHPLGHVCVAGAISGRHAVESARMEAFALGIGVHLYLVHRQEYI